MKHMRIYIRNVKIVIHGQYCIHMASELPCGFAEKLPAITDNNMARVGEIKTSRLHHSPDHHTEE